VVDGLMGTRRKRISKDEALELLQHESLTGLAVEAGKICDDIHQQPVRTFVVDRNINFTNICVSGCRFCAYYKPPGHSEGFVLSFDEVLAKIREAVDAGAVQILMQGGLHPELDIEFYEKLIRAVRKEFPVSGKPQIHSLSPPEIVHIARVSRLDVRTVLARLIDAGLDSLPGGGAEILVDRVRTKLSPNKCSASQWVEVMEAAAGLGLRATATMVFGHIETLGERVEHLSVIRDLQDRTGVFTAFIPWTFQPGNTALGGDAVGAHDYLRTLAISRIFLDNIDNIQASWVTQGDTIAELALRFGANDIGSTMMEENVVAATGVRFRLTKDRIISIIHSAGFDAAERSTSYEILKYYPMSR